MDSTSLDRAMTPEELVKLTPEQLMYRWRHLDDDDTGNDTEPRKPSIAFDQEDWRRQEQENRRFEQIFQARWQLQGMEQRGIKPMKAHE